MAGETGTSSQKETRAPGTFSIPAKIALTEKAVQHFMATNRHLGKIRTAENTEEYGLALDAVSLTSIQTMLKMGYLSLIEVAHPDLMSFRSAIAELTKTLCSHLLLQRFEHDILLHALNAEPVKQWKRAHPSLPLAPSTILQNPLGGGEPRVWDQDAKMIRNSLLEPIFKQIDHTRELERADKEEQRGLCQRYFEYVSAATWSLVAMIHAKWRDRDFLTSIGEMLKSFLGKSSIAEYLSLMLVEIITYAQTRNMVQYVARHYNRGISVDQLLKNRSLREKLIAEMLRDAENTYVTWSIGTGAAPASGRGKLNVSVFNRDISHGRAMDEFKEKSTASLVEQSLNDFMMNPQSEHVDLGMGLSYLSHLRDACVAQGVYFTSSIHHVPKGDLALINCHLQF